MTEPRVPSHQDDRGKGVDVADTAAFSLATYRAEEQIRQEPMPPDQEEATQEQDSLLDASQDLDHFNFTTQSTVLPHSSPPGSSIHEAPSLTIRYWWFELVLTLYTVGLLVAITAVLSLANSEIQAAWTFGLNLNTVIAFLATFLRSGLVVIVEEVLAQAKWVWQQGAQPLQRLTHFDEASRGPWGSLLLWYRVNPFSNDLRDLGKTAAPMMASAVVILSLAIGSFTQQAVRTTTCTVPATSADVFLARAYGSSGSIVRHIYDKAYELHPSVQARVINAWAGALPDRSELAHGCPTGNCTFPEIAPGVTHYTSGICARCLDSTQTITQRRANASESVSGANASMLSTPDRTKVGPVGGYMGSMRLLHVNGSFKAPLDPEEIAYSTDEMPWNVSFHTAHVLALTKKGCNTTILPPLRDGASPREETSCRFPKWNAIAATCVLYPCVQDMQADISNGRLREIVVRKTPFKKTRRDLDPGMVKYPCFVDGVRYEEYNVSLVPNISGRYYKDKIPSECYQFGSFGLILSIWHWIEDTLQGSCTIPLQGKEGSYSDDWQRGFVECTSGWQLAGLFNNGNATFETISAIWDNVATAFTDSLRLSALTDGIDERTTVNGTVWETTICTQFSWPWLLFPATLVFLTLTSLILIMTASTFGADRPPVWKSSILPFLYLLEKPVDPKPQGHCLEDMERSAKDVRVELVKEVGKGWHLIQTTDEEIEMESLTVASEQTMLARTRTSIPAQVD